MNSEQSRINLSEKEIKMLRDLYLINDCQPGLFYYLAQWLGLLWEKIKWLELLKQKINFVYKVFCKISFIHNRIVSFLLVVIFMLVSAYLLIPIIAKAFFILSIFSSIILLIILYFTHRKIFYRLCKFLQASVFSFILIYGSIAAISFGTLSIIKARVIITPEKVERVYNSIANWCSESALSFFLSPESIEISLKNIGFFILNLILILITAFSITPIKLMLRRFMQSYNRKWGYYENSCFF